MACIGSISSDMLFTCGIPPQAPLSEIQECVLINASDIVSYASEGSSGDVAITRVAGTKGWVLDSKRSVTMTTALKNSDIGYPTLDPTFTITPWGEGNAMTVAAGNYRGLAAAELVFAVKHAGMYLVYGLGNPLTCLSAEGDSSASEYARYVFGIEDWQIGTTCFSISAAAYEALKTAAA